MLPQTMYRLSRVWKDFSNREKNAPDNPNPDLPICLKIIGKELPTYWWNSGGSPNSDNDKEKEKNED